MRVSSIPRKSCGPLAETPKTRHRASSDPEVEKHLSRSKNALKLIRRQISVAWLAMAALLGSGFLAYRMLGSDGNSIQCDFLAEGILQTLVFLSLMPLSDDESFCKGVLIVDVCLLTLSVAVFTPECETPQLILRLVDVFRCGVFGAGILWLAVPISKGKVQQRMWMVLRMQAGLSCLRALFICLWVGELQSGQGHEMDKSCLAFIAAIMTMMLLVVSSPELQQSMQWRTLAWLQAHAAVQGAASIVCLIGDCRHEDAVRQARERFRCVEAGKLDAQVLKDNRRDSESDPAPNGLAQHCALGDCDAFLSHSWSDNWEAKARAIRRWREGFVQEHGREPKVWFDKVCIDQTSIDQDLLCLPIFLKGCRRFVMFCGETYLSRLWCILEVFTYIHMGGRADDIEVVLVLREGHEDEDEEAVASTFDRFDAQECRCTIPEDKQRLLSIFEVAFGGRMSAFNSAVKEIMTAVSHGNGTVVGKALSTTLGVQDLEQQV